MIQEINSEIIHRSIFVVPPLARDNNGIFSKKENKKIIEHLINSGVKNLMYGGNANFYNIRPTEFKSILKNLKNLIEDETWLIPSIGPDFGKMKDQTDIVKELGFPTLMILPYMEGGTKENGRVLAIESISKRFGMPVILYIKDENYISPKNVLKLCRNNNVCGIKYAIVKKDPSKDTYLKELINLIDSKLIISGIGEKPVISHFKDFGLKCFTTGSGSIAPRLSIKLFESLKNGILKESYSIRSKFLNFENLRDKYGPPQVLHLGVNACGIAKLGEMQPIWGIIEKNIENIILKESQQLLMDNQNI